MTERARPHGAQQYQGNGNHDWENVTGNCFDGGLYVNRLRVPGGWLYSLADAAVVFVPVPNVVGYAI